MTGIFDEDFIEQRTRWWEKAFDKDASRVVMGLIYGGLYARTVLEPKVRELCAISALTVLHAPAELEAHIGFAFRAGVTEAEVREAIVQMVTYCGVPYVLEAYQAYKRAVKARGGNPGESRQ